MTPCAETQVSDFKADADFLRVAKNCVGRYLPVVPISAFGANVKRLRQARRPPLRAKELAALIGADPSQVSRWEQGKGGLPETPTLLRLAKKLEVAVDQLLAGVDEEYDAIRRDLPDHGRDQGSGLQGRSDAGATATHPRVQQLQEQHAAAITAMQDVAGRLFDALAAQGVAVPGQDAEPRTSKSGARRRARKTG